MSDPMRRRYDLGKALLAYSGQRDLVGRDVGKVLRDQIEMMLQEELDGTVITLDCGGIDHMDYTGADEYLVKIMRRVLSWEYGDVYLILKGLAPVQEGNLVVALERSRIAMLGHDADGPYVMGYLHPYLMEMWALLKQCTKLTARDVVDMTDVTLGLASTTLLNLYKARLTSRRAEKLRAGGQQFVYYTLGGE